MFYRFSQFSGRLSQANAETAYYPQGFGKVPEVKPSSLPSSTKVVPSGGGSSGGFGIVNRVNRVPLFQNLFQRGDAAMPVHLRGGRRDVVIYQSLMVLSVVGTVFTFQQLFMAALGKMKKL
ncbi:cytochrome c oxidase subunit 7A-related protein, mitochondrial-like [Corticium candelabrum]|uniref:cytochrome c oxidase subunit 7A-related protein, mitochondrial-like n=1 Tax=Corticium candelabrum TaxID=121492 RepID=UPI002E273432|nr:cytochrome c oxidase subunit 7A-related protein, mitochondrial-like [Corticium candelabrum]